MNNDKWRSKAIQEIRAIPNIAKARWFGPVVFVKFNDFWYQRGPPFDECNLIIKKILNSHYYEIVFEGSPPYYEGESLPYDNAIVKFDCRNSFQRFIGWVLGDRFKPKAEF